MPWYYRIRKRIINGEPWFDVVEFYRMGKSISWTKESMAPSGESREEVIRTLAMMLKDCQANKSLTEKVEP